MEEMCQLANMDLCLHPVLTCDSVGAVIDLAEEIQERKGGFPELRVTWRYAVRIRWHWRLGGK